MIYIKPSHQFYYYTYQTKNNLIDILASHIRHNSSAMYSLF